MEQKKFDELHSRFLAYCRGENACRRGYADMYAAKNLSQILDVIRRYMSEVTHGLYYHNCCTFLEEVYPKYRADFQQCGFAFNEAPESVSGWCVVCDAEVAVSHMQVAYGFGRAQITAKDNSIVYARDDCKVYYMDSSSGRVEDSCVAEVRNFADIQVCGHARAETWNGTYINAMDNAEVIAHGWRNITASGLAFIRTWNVQRIRTKDLAHIDIDSTLKPKKHE